MLEELLPAEELVIGVLDPALAQDLVGEVVGVLEDREPRHQPRRQRRTAGPVRVDFHALASYTNPGLLAFAEQNPVKIMADGGCTFSLFAKPVSDCDKTRNFFSRNGLSYTSAESSSGTGVVTTIGKVQLIGFDEAAYRKALDEAGFKAAPGTINYVGAVAIVVWLSALIGMVYGPMAAFMVEMFPANIRATSLSLPYHLGVGILGGFLPFAASALMMYQGNIFAGLWYPVLIALATAVVGMIFLPETKDRAIR